MAALLMPNDVVHASQAGWADLSNGNLIAAAESAGFDLMITVDKNLRYQQTLKDRRLSIITLAPVLVQFQYIRVLVPKVLLMLPELEPGTFVTIETPE